MNELLKQIEQLLADTKKLSESFDVSAKKQRTLKLEAMMQAPGFWDDQQSAREKSEEHAALNAELEFFSTIDTDIASLLEIAKSYAESNDEIPKGDREYLDAQYATLKQRFEEMRLSAMLSGPYDNHGAILSIHAGAGGSDAQDWAEMLLRMLTRYAEAKKFKVEILELSKGGEAGIKSVVLEIFGHNAYGLLKSENGVHRLVRQSPFNPAHTRETSFALVEVLPIIKHDEFAINMDDVEVEASTASGHGGQSVNTTYSAIRLFHKPTGVRVSIQNERSQQQNKEKAFEVLYARLFALEQEKRQEERKELRGEFHSPEWGNQIRSYVLHPYKLVKDHRTDVESTDPESVLNGKLDMFVEKYLESKIEGARIQK
jgi:peptide chain release factor 2